MKPIVATMLLVCIALAQDANSDQIAKAAEGLSQLRNGLREPDSFSLDRAWIARSEKRGDAICFTYRARNGFGGMNYSGANYIQNKKGQYALSVATDSWNGPMGNIDDPIPGGLSWFRHCSDQAMKKQTSTDITQELKRLLATAQNP